VATSALTQAGHDVTAIELSEQTALLTRQSAPQANVITGDFLSFNFDEEQFDGICAIAFIHLFPRYDIAQVLQKMHLLLRPDGVALIPTTKHLAASEGYESKAMFVNTNRRYRARYTKQELEERVSASNFVILENPETQDVLEPGKTWMNLIVQKK
jgi:SAM-dependent methyltransferase